jgi:DNA mismatch repair protein MutS
MQALLEDKRDCILLALSIHESTLGLAWLNLAAGQLRVLETLPHNLLSELERLQPAEILLPESLKLPEIARQAMGVEAFAISGSLIMTVARSIR